MQIEKHEFKKSETSILFFILFGLVISAFAIRFAFVAPGVFPILFAISVPAMIIFLARRFSKTDLIISNRGIEKIGIFGAVNFISWDNLINVQYKFVYRGKTSGNYFVIDYYVDRNATRMNLNADEYGSNKNDIARLFLQGSNNRITDLKLRQLAANELSAGGLKTPEPKTEQQLAQEKEENEYNGKLGKVGKIVIAIIVVIVIIRVMQEVMK